MRIDQVYPFAEFAEQYLDIRSASGAEAMARCPFHDSSKYTMQFNLETGLFICFSCSEGGGYNKLAEHFGLPTNRYVEPSLQLVMKKLNDLRHPKKEVKKVLPETYLERFRFPTDYWSSRGFNDSTIEAFDLGYDPIRDAVTIPERDMNGVLCGVTYRFLNIDEDEQRYQYAKGFPRRDNLFASWLVMQDESIETLGLVEGSTDSMTCWQAGCPAVGQYGSSITATQIRLLRRLGVQHIVLFFDNDEAGKKAKRYALGMRRRKRDGKVVWEYDPTTDLRRDFTVSSVRYRSSWPTDPGAMTGRMIRKAFANAKRVI